MRVDPLPIRKGQPPLAAARRRSIGPFWADWAGTVMEQRGCNRWQTFGSPKGRKWLDLPRTVATGCHPLPFGSHGKEGVDGSSPSEGFRKSPANAGLFTSGFIALPLGRSGMKQILEQQGEKAPDFVVWTRSEE